MPVGEYVCKKQYIPRNMHTVFALLCFVVVIHWLIFPYPSGLLHWHCGNLTIAPVSAKQPWWIWINTSCEFIMNDCITTTKQSTTKPCAYFLGYTVVWMFGCLGRNIIIIKNCYKDIFTLCSPTFSDHCWKRIVLLQFYYTPRSCLYISSYGHLYDGSCMSQAYRFICSHNITTTGDHNNSMLPTWHWLWIL